jgi:cell shape-determining protein MreC
MRVVIWTIVGVVVVAAVIFLAVAKPQMGAGGPAKLTPQQVKKAAAQLAKDADEFAQAVKHLQATLTSKGKLDANKTKLAELESKAGQLRAKGTQLESEIGKAAVDTKRAANDLAKDCRKLKHELEEAAK